LLEVRVQLIKDAAKIANTKTPTADLYDACRLVALEHGTLPAELCLIGNH
jgi:hypothetical protein